MTISQWDFLIEYEKPLRRLARRMCRRRYDLVEELYSHAIVDRIGRVLETFDPKRNVPVEMYAFKTLKWYCWKWMNRRMRLEVAPRVPFPPNLAVKAYDQDDIDEVQTYLGRLCPYDASLIQLHDLCGLTFEEMADILETTKGTARNHYNRAFDRLQGVAGAS